MTMADIQNKEQIVFSIDTAPVVFEILQKYNLKESDDQVLEKLEKGQPLQPEIILLAVENIVLEKMTEMGLLSFLQQSLPASPQISQNIAKDIKEKLLPMARKATPAEIALLESEKTEETAAIPKTSVPYEPVPINEPAPGETPAAKKPPAQTIAKPAAGIKEAPAIKRPARKKSDAYTEEI